MLYCERCRTLFSGEGCPGCGRDNRARAPRGDDPCFLAERGQPWDGMLADVLRQNDIPFFTTRRLGAALAMRVGSMLESQRFYVRLEDLERANAIVDELFGADAPR